MKSRIFSPISLISIVVVIAAALALALYASPKALKTALQGTGTGAVLSSLSPVIGPVGTVVTATGSGFDAVSNDLFFTQIASNRSGFIPGALTSNGGTQLYFTIPATLEAACSFNPNPCDLASYETTPGVYHVAISDPQSPTGMSNELTFTVANVGPPSNGNVNGTATIPQNVVATANPKNSSVFVRWDPLDLVRIDGYKVYRSTQTPIVCFTTPCDPVEYEYIGQTSGAVVYLDTTAVSGNTYTYKVSVVTSAGESPTSDPSNAVTVGANGSGAISLATYMFPYSSTDIISLSVSGLNDPVTWSSSDSALVNVDAEGNMSISNNADPKGGASFVTARDTSGNYATLVVTVWPRGDTDGNFVTNAYDQNNVAVGWNRN